MNGLAREAARLNLEAAHRTGAGLRLPALLFVTDPERTPDPVAVAARLPRGSGVIFRGFGRPDAEETAERLAHMAHARGLTLLIGADPGLATRVGAHGVHLPERLMHLAPALRRRRRGWMLTTAAHSGTALRRAGRLNLDAALFSPVFESASPSAAGVRPWGPLRFAAMARTTATPIYALGGVTAATARRLHGAVGLAAVDGVLG